MTLKTPVPKQRWELTRDKVQLETKIGEGAFGEVWKGTLREDPSKPPIEVAVKVVRFFISLSPNSRVHHLLLINPSQLKVNEENKAKIDDMHREARMMRQYKHRLSRVQRLFLKRVK